MAGSKTYIGRFVASDNTPYFVLISKRGDVGELEDITLGADAVRITYESENKLSPIMSSKAEVRVLSKRDGQFVDLYSLDGRDVELIVLRADSSSWSIVWRGTIDPEFYEEPYTSPDNYFVTLRFSDLGALRRSKWIRPRERATPESILRSILADIPRIAIGEFVGEAVRGVCNAPLEISLSTATTISGGRSILSNSYVDTAVWFAGSDEEQAVPVLDVLESLLRSLALRLEIRGSRAYVYDAESARRAEPIPVHSRGTDALMQADRIYSEVKVKTPKALERGTSVSKHKELPKDGALELPLFSEQSAVSALLALKGQEYSLYPIVAGEEATGVIMFYDPTQTQGLWRTTVDVRIKRKYRWGIFPRYEPEEVKAFLTAIAQPSTEGERYGLDGVAVSVRTERKPDGSMYQVRGAERVCPGVYPSFMTSPHLKALLDALDPRVRDTEALMRAQLGKDYTREVLTYTSVIPTPINGQIRVGCELLIGLSPSLAQDATDAGWNLVNLNNDDSIEDKLWGTKQFSWVDKPDHVGQRDNKWRARQARLKVKIVAKSSTGTTYYLTQQLDRYWDRVNRVLGGNGTSSDTDLEGADLMTYRWEAGQAKEIDLQFGYKGFNYGSWTKPVAKYWDISRLSNEVASKVAPPQDLKGGGLIIPAPPSECTEVTISVLDAFVLDYEEDDVRTAVLSGVAAPSYILVRGAFFSSPIALDTSEEDTHEERYIINQDAYEPLEVELALSTDAGIGSASPSRLMSLDGSLLTTLEREIEDGKGGKTIVRGTLGELYARSVASQYGRRGHIIEGAYTPVLQAAPIILHGEKYIRTREEISLRDCRSRMSLALLQDDKEVERIKRTSKPPSSEDKGLDLIERERLIREIIAPKVGEGIDKAKQDIDKKIDSTKGVLEGLIRDSALSVEYSADGQTDWHTHGRATDKFLRQRVGDDGVWSEPIRIAGEDAIMVQVWSSSGNTFANGQVDTELVAFVYRGAEDISDSIPPGAYSWERISGNPDTDRVWTSLHSGIGRRLRLSSEDVVRRANFNVVVEGTLSL